MGQTSGRRSMRPDYSFLKAAQAPIEYILIIDLPRDFTISPESFAS